MFRGSSGCSLSLTHTNVVVKALLTEYEAGVAKNLFFYLEVYIYLFSQAGVMMLLCLLVH